MKITYQQKHKDNHDPKIKRVSLFKLPLHCFRNLTVFVYVSSNKLYTADRTKQANEEIVIIIKLKKHKII